MAGALTIQVCQSIAAAVIVTLALGASLAAAGLANRPERAPEPPPAAVPLAQEAFGAQNPEHHRRVILEVRDAAENKPLPARRSGFECGDGHLRLPSWDVLTD